jgi:hypothetical protein
MCDVRGVCVARLWLLCFQGDNREQHGGRLYSNSFGVVVVFLVYVLKFGIFLKKKVKISLEKI